MGEERNQFFKKLEKNFTYKPVTRVKIGNKWVGDGERTFIIAEVGANHRGKIENALRFIKLAAQEGADAVKFQHLTHDKIAADTPVTTPWKGKSGWKTLAEFYKPSELPYEWTDKLIKHAKKHKIIFLSTPFDKEAVDILDKANVPAFKVASYEMTDDILLTYIAKKKKPIILSTGMADLEEVSRAVRIIQKAENNNIVVLHCVSIYPPKSFADLNLRAIQTLKEALKIPVGYSDHSAPPWIAAPLAAVTLGACAIEKHFTDTQTGGSHDDLNSLEVNNFKRMVDEIRLVEKAISSNGIKQPVVYPDHDGDEIYDRWARRSIYAAINIPKGAKLTEEMIITLRPWGGIEPKHFELILGKKVVRNIKARSPITWNDLLEG
ncbi:MAG TPA: N-acetylneuraminate synthase family protein [Patescibacteria group bacterium]